MKLKLLFAILLFALNGYTQNLFNYNGVVIDSTNQVPLEGVNIVITELSTGTVSTQGGDFMLFLPAGSYQICFSMEGFKPYNTSLELKEDCKQMISLLPSQKKSGLFNKLFHKKVEEISTVEIAQLTPKHQEDIE